MITEEAEELRHRAEELITAGTSKSDKRLTEDQMLALIHELELHKIELELQNIDLMFAKNDSDRITKNYHELYAESPSGQFTLSRDGSILELNPSGARMLNRDRNDLINSVFYFFIPEAYRSVFNSFMNDLFESGCKCTCEIELSEINQRKQFIHLTGDASGYREKCFLTAVDITDSKINGINLQKNVLCTSRLLELFNIAPGLTDKEFSDHVLDIAVEMTESKIGFFHLISDDQTNVILTTWNNETRKNCEIPESNHYPLEKAGNWADCVRLKQVVIENNYLTNPIKKGLPEGHPHIFRTLTIQSL